MTQIGVDRSAPTSAASGRHKPPRRGPTGRPPLAIGVYGASGTSGAELVRLVDGHPACSLRFTTSRTHAGRSLRAVDPSAPDVTLRHPAEVEATGLDVAFVCLPHGHAAAVAAHCASRSAVTIDLSGDLRLRDAQLHARVYGTEREPDLAARAAYGLTELGRPALRGATVVSNPGCYPTCAGLALYPLARSRQLPPLVFIDAKSGISGAGRAATEQTHFCAVVDDVRPYKLGRDHRHTAEIEQTLADAGSPNTRVVFCPHVVPLERGMLVTAVVEVPRLSARQIHELYAATYRDEVFVDVLPLGEPARVRAVTRTNRAVIGIHPVNETDHVVITCAIDNLLKGAAGQAVQNMNLLFGLPESLGLVPGQTAAWVPGQVAVA